MFDKCILGVARQFNTVAVAYDRARIIGALVAEGMSLEEAEDYFEVNVAGGWMGPRTPIFVDVFEAES